MGKINIFEKLGFTESKNEQPDQSVQADQASLHDDLQQTEQISDESAEVDVLRQLELELKEQEQAGTLEQAIDQFDEEIDDKTDFAQSDDDEFEIHFDHNEQASQPEELTEEEEYPFAQDEAQEDIMQSADEQITQTLDLADEQANSLDLDNQLDALSKQLEQAESSDLEVTEMAEDKGEGLIKTSDKIEQFLALNNYERPADSPSLETIFSDDSNRLAHATAATAQQGNDVEKKLDLMIETYEKNRLLTIEDIYRKAALLKEKKATIFMVDIYAKALPENLPSDIKRDSVLNIMRASDLDINELLNDAYMRIDTLNRTLESVVQTTEKIKLKNRATIDDLESQIKDLKKATLDRERFQESQNTTLEYEIQRIINIVDFIKVK